eukprot:c8148_g1_i1.p1 GENE.c8148_g1_i1~~c8148_g1_i1.p1  ORF type:complete len:201 (+),score=108.83 c8148_g1_i1:23-604(+)
MVLSAFNISPGHSLRISDQEDRTVEIYHIALGKEANSSSKVILYIREKDKKYVFCRLEKGKMEEMTIRYPISGEELSFQVEGNCSVDLIGNEIYHSFFKNKHQEEKEIDEEDIPKLVPTPKNSSDKTKNIQVSVPTIKGEQDRKKLQASGANQKEKTKMEKFMEMFADGVDGDDNDEDDDDEGGNDGVCFGDC